MNGLAKRWLSGALTPLARVARSPGESWRRVWAHARLRAAIAGPVDPSVVILGVAEIRGTGRIEMGRDLFLYPGLYLETQDQGRIRIGDEVVMSRGVHVVAFQEVTIGAGTLIGEYASLRDANHRFGGDRRLRKFKPGKRDRSMVAGGDGRRGSARQSARHGPRTAQAGVVVGNLGGARQAQSVVTQIR